MLLLCVFTGELNATLDFPQLMDTNFLLTLAVSMVFGLIVSHAMFLCTKLNDPVTTSVVGAFKNCLMTFIGAMIFPDYVFEWSNVAGLTVSMVGAIWYGFLGALGRDKPIKLDKETSSLASKASGSRPNPSALP